MDDTQMTTNTELIATLRTHAMFDYCTTGNEAADAIEALESDNKFKDDLLKKCSDECFVLTNRSDALQAQLAAAQPERAPLSLQEIADAWGLKPENIPASDIEAVREIEAAIKQGGQP